MSLFIPTKYRTGKSELMDDFSISGAILHDTLDKLASINQWLGGNRVTIQGLKMLLKNHPKDKSLTIIDLGCGGGDVLRAIAKFGIREGYSFSLIGVDANEETVKYASELSQMHPDIQYIHCDIFSDEFKALEYDIVVSTLFLHHFNEEQLIKLLSMILSKASLGIVVNDLHRHPLAYYLFKTLCSVISNKMVIEDGLTSVLRGFKRDDLKSITTKIGAKSHINWKWAFRYQWIIQKNK